MTREVEHYLATVGADRDADGKFLLVGEEGQGPSTFMGAGVEMVVPASCCYLVGGKRCNLAAGLSSTSYGMSVVVI